MNKKPMWAGLGVVGLIAVAGALAALQKPELRWRAEVLMHKVQGDLPGLSMTEIARWLRPGSPVYLGGLAEDPNPFVSITNILTTEADRDAGQMLYEANCSRCHGGNAEGGTGPALVGHGRGTSDWSMFRTIQNGIPNTTMQAQPLNERQIWRVIAFLRGKIISPSGANDVAGSPRTVDAGDPHLTSSGEDWKGFAGSLFGWRFSKLVEINPENAHRLSLAWMYQIGSDERMVETTPLVIDGIMFATEPPNTIVALEAATGQVLWDHVRPLADSAVLCCGAVNRGVAIGDDTLYMGTLDAHLIAVDASTGDLKWDVEVAPDHLGYSITSAPLVVDQLVITGIAGGEFGISGFLAAYDRETGEEVWRFNTIPADGEEYSDTWNGGRERGGVPTWGTGTYDPQLGLVYWGAGHPAPDFNGDGRVGDNLYSNSLLALDAKTGELAWHFQFTPHDEWDWDSTQMPVLVDHEVQGVTRKLVLFANRNGFYYVLDRTDGQFVAGLPFVKQTWANGLAATGRPIVREESRPTREGALVYPSVTGATNWWPPSFSPITDMFYVPFLERPTIFFKWPQDYATGELYLGGIARPVSGYQHYTGVRALDPVTGKRKWELRFPERGGWSQVGGVLTTASNVLFVGDNQTFYAADAKTGELLWHVPTGGGINAAPMTYAVQGRQYVTIAAGRALLTFALPREAWEQPLRELPVSGQ